MIDAVFCMSSGAPQTVNVIVARDAHGIETYWYPVRTMLRLAGYPTDLPNLNDLVCNSLRSFKELRQRYNLRVNLLSTKMYVMDEALNNLLYGKWKRKNAAQIVRLREAIVTFRQSRRFAVNELLNQLMLQYIQTNTVVR